MRVQPFLNFMSQNYANVAGATQVAQTPRFRGGWEGWLQVEIAQTFLYTEGGAQYCTREAPYPAPYPNIGEYITNDGGITANANQAARADFMLQRGGNSPDETYVELKCTNFKTTGDPVADAWARFFADVDKIGTMQATNRTLNSIATLCYSGVLPLQIADENLYLANKPISWYSDGRRTYIWYCAVPYNPDPNTAVQPIEAVAAQYLDNQQLYNGLLMVGLSPV